VSGWRQLGYCKATNHRQSVFTNHEARCIPPVLRTDVCQIAKISILFHQIHAAEKDGKDFGPEV